MSACQLRQCVAMQIRLPQRFAKLDEAAAVATFQLQCWEMQERTLRTDCTSAAQAAKQVLAGNIEDVIMSTCDCWPVICVAWSVSSLPTFIHCWFTHLPIQCHNSNTTPLYSCSLLGSTIADNATRTQQHRVDFITYVTDVVFTTPKHACIAILSH